MINQYRCPTCEGFTWFVYLRDGVIEVTCRKCGQQGTPPIGPPQVTS